MYGPKYNIILVTIIKNDININYNKKMVMILVLYKKYSSTLKSSTVTKNCPKRSI